MPKLRAWFVLLLLILPGLSASAQESTVVVTNNSGSNSTIWYISGEPSLIINGFDLTAKAVKTPAFIESISINVRTPRPGNPVEAVVYQDADGGSPQNATLLARIPVDITEAGIFTATFPEPVRVSQQFLWVGFYLPVDFEFRADTQGASVLTYWAWKPGTTFDLASLGSATVFGPADGSAPVNINMGGVARITVNLLADDDGQAVTSAAPVQQIVGNPSTDLSVMTPYQGCSTVYYDSADLLVSYQDGIDIFCQIRDVNYSPKNPEFYRQRGLLFDLYVFGLPSGNSTLPIPITHCMKPAEGQLDRAVIGVASGFPLEWQILKTVRYSDRICAELYSVGFVSVFVPR